MPNYQIQAGTLLESFETIGDWTSSGTAGGASTVDTSIFQEGAGSLKLAADAAASSNWFATKTISVDLSRAGVISIDVYVTSIDATSGITIYLSPTSGFTAYFSRGITGLTLGWNRIRIYKEFWSNTGAADWASTMIRLRVRTDSKAAGGSIVYFDNLVYGTYHRPKVVWTSDDGIDDQYTEWYTYMRTKGLKGTSYVHGVEIGTADNLTLAQVIEMQNYGWDICNHTYNHTNLTTLATQAEMEAQVALNIAYLRDNGLDKNNSSKHFCYPNGGYNQTVLDALTAKGILTARSIVSQAGLSVATPALQPLLFVTRNLGSTVTLASVKTDIDNAIAAGCTLVIESHKFVTTPTTTTEWAIADMQALVDYIKARESQIDCVTITEWYKGLIQSRKNS